MDDERLTIQSVVIPVTQGGVLMLGEGWSVYPVAHNVGMEIDTVALTLLRSTDDAEQKGAGVLGTKVFD